MDTHLELPATPAAAEQARAAVKRQLDRWGLPHCLDDALLVTSELVTNAVRYGAAPIRMHLKHSDDTVLISVEDGSYDSPPHPRDADEDEPNGRGLLLVEALSRQWGWAYAADSKTVWAELGCGAGDLASR